MKRGLVLEGGGMRAMFTAGVMDVLMDAGIRFDGLIGVSAGAAFGVNYKSRQRGRIIRYNSRFAPDPRYMGLHSLLTTGNFMNAQFCYHTVPMELDLFDTETFERDPMEFHLVCTDARLGTPVYQRLTRMGYDEIEWIRASGSLPLLSRPVDLCGRKLLDGGLTDSIPLRYFQARGYDRCVVILTQPLGYLKRRSRLLPLFHLLMPHYPAVIRLMRQRHRMYNAQLHYLLRQQIEGNALLVYPDHEIAISRVSQSPRNIRAAYDLGLRKGEAILPQVQRFLHT